MRNSLAVLRFGRSQALELPGGCRNIAALASLSADDLERLSCNCGREMGAGPGAGFGLHQGVYAPGERTPTAARLRESFGGVPERLWESGSAEGAGVRSGVEVKDAKASYFRQPHCQASAMPCLSAHRYSRTQPDGAGSQDSSARLSWC